ncbi:DNA-binding HxlR family transcriptional regulator [Cryobacterium sp. MP_M5]|uniref:winged helix-turn-helix transcriptional regulator n=1 Tax=unclassified Cryobacterium TaxID=2649013 RepID=UPI0018C99562|nr:MULTISPECIES: helix-turn-helix domain-containing protein [unclassified Cryobacterium]MBG6060118.1 DNA-binding HxlR family transcriptional regulator [Cryobacterium sp. MP_M3]MEC5177892.1 DNA-binding HxlR family transcriptional regulator [Cryobacterium sp. MP_M5]
MKVSFEVSRARPGAVGGLYPAKCATRTVLDHVTSKWGVLVLLALEQESLRWGELRRAIEGISEKMLASTLRTLEADGFVNREAQATIPPRVDYELTERGRELTRRLLPLMDWIADNADEIVAL